MVSMVPESNPLTPREEAEMPRPRMAKAILPEAKVNLRKSENCDFRSEIGRVVQRTGELAGLTRLQQFADAIKRDPRQVARWIDGSERAQFDAIWAVDALRVPLVQALAEQCSMGVQVQTVITLTKKVG